MSKQLVQPNLSVTGQLGWCLQYADRVFGVPARFPTAWDGWMQTDYPHHDRNIPQDVAVPLWFDYWESGIRYGHVVVSVPGKGLYSSPWKAGQTHAVLSSIAEVERIYGVTYVGWSEDISNVKVIEGGKKMMTENGVRFGYLAVSGGIQPKDVDVKYWTGRDPEEFCKNLYGQSNFYMVAANGEIAALKQKLANAGSTEAEKKLQAIKDALK